MGRVAGYLISAVLAAVMAQAAYALDFSADMVSTTRDGVQRGKAYVTDRAARIEMPGLGASITRIDQKKVIVVMDAERMYMEQPFDPRIAASVSERVDGEVSRELLGSESIEGRPVKKYKVTADSMGERSAMYQWIDDATMIPLRTEDVSGAWKVEYRNFKSGPQDPGLFEPPAGYKRFAVPTMDDIASMMSDAGSR